MLKKLIILQEGDYNEANIEKKENNMAMKENSRKVFEYLKGTTAAGTDVTAADIAAALGIEKKSVDGSVTSALQRKGLAVRTKAEVEVTDEAGKTTHKEVKFITLTDAGMAFDPDAEVAPAAAE